MERSEVTKMRRIKKGLWKPEEDLILKKYVATHGEGNWTIVSEKSGLMRGGKSCRLRWKNYLRPNIKRGTMSEDEKDLIIRLHKLLGNRWSLIAGRLPGRTDNEIKNYWNTHLNKRVSRRETTNIDSENKKKLCQSLCPQPENTSKGSLNGNEEESTVSNPWMKDMKSFNYGTESPPSLPNFDAPFYEDESFLPILDSIVMFEAFGSIGEDAYS